MMTRGETGWGREARDTVTSIPENIKKKKGWNRKRRGGVDVAFIHGSRSMGKERMSSLSTKEKKKWIKKKESVYFAQRGGGREDKKDFAGPRKRQKRKEG